MKPVRCSICRAGGVERLSTWIAVVVLRDLPPHPKCTHRPPCKPKNVRVPVGIGTCDEHASAQESVTASDLLKKHWPVIAQTLRGFGLPAPNREKTTLEWVREVSAPGGATT